MAWSCREHHPLSGASVTLVMLPKAISVPGRGLSCPLVRKRDAWPGSSRGCRKYGVAGERAQAHKRRASPRAMLSWCGDTFVGAVSSDSTRKSVVWRECSREPLDGGLSPQDDKTLSQRQHTCDSIDFYSRWYEVNGSSSAHTPRTAGLAHLERARKRHGSK